MDPNVCLILPQQLQGLRFRPCEVGEWVLVVRQLQHPFAIGGLLQGRGRLLEKHLRDSLELLDHLQQGLK